MQPNLNRIYFTQMKDQFKTAYNKREIVPGNEFIFIKAIVETEQITARISENYPEPNVSIERKFTPPPAKKPRRRNPSTTESNSSASESASDNEEGAEMTAPGTEKESTTNLTEINMS